jgi:hypothetical protein
LTHSFHVTINKKYILRNSIFYYMYMLEDLFPSKWRPQVLESYHVEQFNMFQATTNYQKAFALCKLHAWNCVMDISFYCDLVKLGIKSILLLERVSYLRTLLHKYWYSFQEGILFPHLGSLSNWFLILIQDWLFLNRLFLPL